MARRTRAAAVEAFLTDSGHQLSKFHPEEEEWDPGIRVAQGGTRCVFVFWDGPGEADQLDAITAELRGQGYHVVPTQQGRVGRRRLEVTLP